VPAIAPTILKDPSNETIGASGTVVFKATARGTGPLQYQWLFQPLGGTNSPSPILNATNSILTLTGVRTTQAGQYSLFVSNTAGTATSLAAVLRVIPSIIVAVFDDSSYVNTYGGPNAQSDTVQASITRLGHRPTAFTSISGAANGTNPMLFPAFEAGDPTPSLSQAARDGVQSFVAKGGVIILHGTYNDYNRPTRFLNAIFGFSLSGAYASAPFTRTSQAAGTAFADDPDWLPRNNNTTVLQKSSLPAGARSIYENSDQQTVVAWLPFGSGKIIFLGWNWTDAIPVGQQDGGWLKVLGSAIEQTVPPPPSAPEILVQPQDRIVLAGTNVQ